jgi:hypothetical protein
MITTLISPPPWQCEAILNDRRQRSIQTNAIVPAQASENLLIYDEGNLFGLADNATPLAGDLQYMCSAIARVSTSVCQIEPFEVVHNEHHGRFVEFQTFGELYLSQGFVTAKSHQNAEVLCLDMQRIERFVKNPTSPLMGQLQQESCLLLECRSVGSR